MFPLVFAHAGHWLPQVAFVAPVAVLIGTAAVKNRRGRSTVAAAPRDAS